MVLGRERFRAGVSPRKVPRGFEVHSGKKNQHSLPKSCFGTFFWNRLLALSFCANYLDMFKPCAIGLDGSDRTSEGYKLQLPPFKDGFQKRVSSWPKRGPPVFCFAA